MKEKQLHLSVTALTMIFTNQLFAEEPPILQKEVEFRTQSEIKRSQELLRLMEQERRMAQEQADAEEMRQKEAKQRAADQARQAKEAEAKRIAEQQAAQEAKRVAEQQAAQEAEAKRIAEQQAAQEAEARAKRAAENNRYTRSSGGSANSSDVAAAKRHLDSLPSACSSSSMSTNSDGTVNLRIRCQDGSKSMDGRISIKDGIVTDVE